MAKDPVSLLAVLNFLRYGLRPQRLCGLAVRHSLRDRERRQSTTRFDKQQLPNVTDRPRPDSPVSWHSTRPPPPPVVGFPLEPRDALSLYPRGPSPSKVQVLTTSLLVQYAAVSLARSSWNNYTPQTLHTPITYLKAGLAQPTNVSPAAACCKQAVVTKCYLLGALLFVVEIMG
ncbi:hypothetical protein ElyMa_000043500 [Elysia marginata]|uniref:Uncharacterized protein n=1 Tax=Elysia marginata TaxID=1093978 RepID=A0AAV4EDR0_9GAST|nr:hypothetical protein ElyMa_000043500 [Elysia marginata]